MTSSPHTLVSRLLEDDESEIRRLLSELPDAPPVGTQEMLDYWRTDPELTADLDYVGSPEEGKVVTLCDRQGTPMATFPFGSTEDCNRAVAYCLAQLNRPAASESELDDVNPKHYLDALPPRFDYNAVMERIQRECSYSLDVPADRKAFIKWLKAHEYLFPDVGLAIQIIKNNDSWCTDNDLDMTIFFERLGFPAKDATCPHCDGDGYEPGAPVEDDGEQHALCGECHGSGTRMIDCECDEDHRAADDVCAWCRARGRRHWNDPAV